MTRVVRAMIVLISFIYWSCVLLGLSGLSDHWEIFERYVGNHVTLQAIKGVRIIKIKRISRVSYDYENSHFIIPKFH